MRVWRRGWIYGEGEEVKSRYIKFVLSHRLIILLFLLSGSAFFAYELSRVRVHTNFFELYPPRHPFIRVYREFRKLFGTANLLMIVMESRNNTIYSIDFIRKIDEVTRFLMDTKGVNPFQVISLTHPSLRGFRAKGFSVSSVPIVEALPRNDRDLEDIRLNVERNEGVKGFVVSGDERSTLLIAGLWEEELDFEYLWERMKELRDKFSSSDVEIHITGFPALYAWIHHYMPEIYVVFGLTALSLLILLFFFFGEIKGVVIPFGAGIVSALWGFGIAGVVGLSVDPLLLVVPLLLSARALSHSVQILERYYDDYSKFPDKFSAIEGSISPLIKPASLSIITDGLGILTIAVSGIPLMWKLAIYSSFWIASILIGVLTLSPLLLSYFPPPGESVFFKSRKIYDFFLNWHIKIMKVKGNPERIFFIFWILLIAGAITGTRLRVGNIMPGNAILFDDHPYNIAMKKINEGFIGVNRLVIIAEGNEEGAIKKIDNLRKIEEFSQRLKERTGASSVLTLTGVVKKVYRLFREGDPNWEVLPYKERDVGAISLTLSQGRELQNLFSSDFKSATVTLFYKQFSGDYLKHIINESKNLTEEMKSDKLKFRMAGGLLGVLAAVNDEVERSYWLILFTVLFTTFILLILFFKSFRISIILITPLLLSQFISEAYMFFSGIDMNINSLPVAAVGIGVGIDYGIYFISRLMEEMKNGKNFLEAYEITIRTTGKAIFFTASTLIIGVIFWVFTPLKFTSEMAELLALLMFLNYEGAIIFVPSLSKIILNIKSEKEVRE